MAKTSPAVRTAQHVPGRPARSGFAAGVSVFGATMLLIAGVAHFVEGLVVLVNGPEFLVTTPNYIFAFNATAWGWFHLVVGVVAAASGAFIFTGNLVARSAGVAIAAVSALANFLWLPHYPLWAMVIIALDVLVIWALTTVDLSER
jgi:hypothetical protein